MPIQGSEFQDVIRDLVRRTGKSTQDAQARKLGVSDTSLSAYIAGTQVPRESTLIKMLTAVGIPPKEHARYIKIRSAAEIAHHARVGGRKSPLPPPTEGPPEEPPPDPGPPRGGLPPWAHGRIPLWGWAAGLVLLGFAAGAIALITILSPPPSPAAAADSPPSAVPVRCSRVNVLSSPVYVEIGDREPVKSKNLEDRVRTFPVPHRTASDGTAYQAVALPDRRDSPNGVGWMRAADLVPDPHRCAGLGRRF